MLAKSPATCRTEVEADVIRVVNAGLALREAEGRRTIEENINAAWRREKALPETSNYRARTASVTATTVRL